MADSRAIWFSTFVLVVFCLGGLAGYRIAGHLPPRERFVIDEAPPRPGPPGRDGRGLEGRGFGGPGRPVRPLGGLFGRGPGGPPSLPLDLVNRLTSELGLDAAQQDQLKKILDDRRGRLEAVHREARERFEKEQRDLRAAIRAVLTPEQQTRFDKFLDRR